VAKLEAEMKSQVGNRCRILSFASEVFPSAGIAEQLIAGRSWRHWQARGAKTESPDVLERTRELACKP